MTYNEKKSLYESIMKDVAKIVKRRINEQFDMLKNEILQRVMMIRKEMSSETFNNIAYVNGTLDSYLIKLIEKYDEYVEDVIYLVFDDNISSVTAS